MPDEEYPVPGDDAPARGENTPAPIDDAPAVVDDLSSSKGFLACCCRLPWICARWRSFSATVVCLGMLSWTCARRRFVSVTVSSSGMMLLSCGMQHRHDYKRLPTCWGVAVTAVTGVANALVALLIASRFALNDYRPRSPICCSSCTPTLPSCRWVFPASSVVVMPCPIAVV